MRAGTDELPQVVLANAAGATDPHDGQCSFTDATDVTDIPGYEGTPAACGIDGHTTWTTHMGLIRCRTCQPPAISTAEQLPL